MLYIKLFESFSNDDFLKLFDKSKVVDKDDRPLLVYHCTTKDYTIPCNP